MSACWGVRCWNAGGVRRVELLPEFGGAGEVGAIRVIQGFRVVAGQAAFAKGRWR